MKREKEIQEFYVPPLLIVLTCAILLCTFIGLGVYVFSDGNETRNEQVNVTGSKEVCVSPECVHASASSRIRRSLDPSVNPCDDFYSFACGGWIQSNPIPDTKTKWDQFQVLREQLNVKLNQILKQPILSNEPEQTKQAKMFYKSCVDQTSQTGQLRDFVNPLFDLYNTSGDLGSLLGQLKRLIDGKYLVSLSIMLDAADSSHFAIHLDQPTFGLPKELLVQDTMNQMAFSNYKELIRRSWEEVFGSVEDEPEDVAEQIGNFEKELALISSTAIMRLNASLKYNPITIGALQSNPEFQDINLLINWKQFISETFLSFDKYDFSLGHRDNKSMDMLRIIVSDVPYLKALGHQLRRHDQGVVTKYLKWRVIQTLGKDASLKLRHIFQDFDKTLYGVSQESSSHRCTESANIYYGVAISYHYIHDEFSDQSKKNIISLVDSVRESFIRSLNTADWIAQESTREAALIKALKMKEFIAYPDWLYNQTALDIFYDKLALRNPSNHFSNVLNLREWTVQQNLKRLDGKKDSNQWGFDPTVVNALYLFSYNSITFPAAILQPPFYSHGSSMQALNFGAIGSVIGHEITHGFDDKGRQSDWDGNVRNWWDPTTLENYIHKAKCFVDQYNKYEVTTGNGKAIQLKGQLTLGENIADNGGFRHAYLAYKNYMKSHEGTSTSSLPGLDFTSDQLFFLGYAQAWCGSSTLQGIIAEIEEGIHSPNYFRVLGVLENSPEFLKAFECPSLKAKRPHLCQLW